MTTIDPTQLHTITGGADSIGAQAGRKAAEVANGFRTNGIGGAASAIGNWFSGPAQQPAPQGPSPARPGMAGLALRERMSSLEP